MLCWEKGVWTSVVGGGVEGALLGKGKGTSMGGGGV